MCFLKNKTVWSLIFLFIICAAIIAWGYFASANMVSNKTLLAGYSISPALIIWYFFYKFSKNSLKRSAQYCAFASIFLSLIICFLIGYKRNRDGEAKISQPLQTELQRTNDIDGKNPSSTPEEDADDELCFTKTIRSRNTVTVSRK